MESFDPSFHTPEEKLRRISFGAFQLDEFPIILKKPCRELNGWENENWDLKTEYIISKSVPRGEKDKYSPKKKKEHTMKQIQVHDRTTKYIEKIQQKLNELIEIRAQNHSNTQWIQKNQPNNMISNHYPTPQRVQNQRAIKSYTDWDKKYSEHNFTSTMYDKRLSKDWHRSFNVRRTQEISQTKNIDTLEPKIDKVNTRLVYGRSVMLPRTERKLQQMEERVYHNKSMMETYEDFTKRTGEVFMISYPLIDGEKKLQKVPKPNKLHEFYQRFQSQESKQQRCKYIGLSKNKRFRMAQNNKQQTVFHIKITQHLQNRNRKKSFGRVV